MEFDTIADIKAQIVFLSQRLAQETLNIHVLQQQMALGAVKIDSLEKRINERENRGGDL